MALALRRPTLLEIDPWWVADVGFSKMRVTSPFGDRPGGFHGGLDIGNARLGDVLLASGAGRVIAAGLIGSPWTSPKPSDAWWYSQPASADGKRGGLFGPPSRWTGATYGGRMVVIELAPGVVAIYAHMATVEVAVGDIVAVWERIGTVGDSGSAYRQGHTHFGIQAPAAAVPAGVKTHTTALGFGLDVDPWPLITGQAVLTIQEDDVKIKGRFLRHVTNLEGVVTSDAHFRAGVETGDDAPIALLPAGERFLPVVVVAGRSAGTAPDRTEWYGGIKTSVGPDSIEPTFGYVHSSVLPRSADDSTTALTPVVTVGSPGEVAAANGRTEALRQDSIEHLEGLKASHSAAIDRAIADLRAP